MTKALKVAIAGLGTVGAGTVRLLAEQAETIAARCGRPIRVTAVSARSKGRDRGCDLTGIEWFDDPVAMAREADADVVCELVGGSDGVAREVCEAAIGAGRHVVTANKALLAHHGTELAEKAEAAGVQLRWEAAVAGGIPIIKALREGLAGNSISRVYGILNGTCNYILSTMRETGRDFADVLADAQRLGYAEADPSFDIDGVDAAHKLALLTAVAFGTKVDFASAHVEGIRALSALDIEYAEELGYRIKLLGIARKTDAGIEQRVHPCMVRASAPIASVEDVYNAVVAEGDFVGRSVYEGRGAGAGPTASAVAADIIDIAAGRSSFTFGVAARDLRPLPKCSMENHVGAYYIRLMVVDKQGVFADIAAALRDANVSMEAILQRGRAPGEVVPVVLTLHETVEASLNDALRRITAIDGVVEPPMVIRIEAL
ncbi:homoserine dehydrogenase [Novispirillum sp. DQ9]|uniref:homoserine dehydrogenase n=1 Tax=Novispirillum sp. DQ9 TaxID=3398612 RepID=UPI003C7EA506